MATTHISSANTLVKKQKFYNLVSLMFNHFCRCTRRNSACSSILIVTILRSKWSKTLNLQLFISSRKTAK
uniref:Uncharacterized protein n=1 Tax=Arundo donax TaxID=35708 RepID=A0A0A9BLD2_ARUDO